MPILQQNISLKPYHTFGIDVRSAFFIEVKQESQLREALGLPKVKTLPLLILGGGSNMLFTKDYEGVVLKISIPGIDVVENGNEVLLTAGAGVIWNDLVKYCVDLGYGGIENLTLIPGTVGAAPIQNIGAYGVELKDVFVSCTAMARESGEVRAFNFDDCKFGYRESVFKNELKDQYIITSVTLKLKKAATVQTHYGAIQAELAARAIENPTIKDVSDVVASIRVSKLPDPSTIGNAGSFFKNPIIEKEQFEKLIAQFPNVVHYPSGDGKIKLAAGWLIESCGFKGKIVGETGTWKNQALVLVNHGEASGQEVYNFSEDIIESVFSKFGVRLSREVNVF